MSAQPRQVEQLPRAVSITLPWPPSVNHYWLILRRGKLAGQPIISDAGKKFRKAVSDAVLVQKVRTHWLAGKLQVEILAFPPDLRARDLDNLPKGVLDGLKKAGVFRDDCDIDDLRIRRRQVKKLGELVITITEIPGLTTTSGYLFDTDC